MILIRIDVPTNWLLYISLICSRWSAPKAADDVTESLFFCGCCCCYKNCTRIPLMRNKRWRRSQHKNVWHLANVASEQGKSGQGNNPITNKQKQTDTRFQAAFILFFYSFSFSERKVQTKNRRQEEEKNKFTRGRQKDVESKT